MLMTLRKGEEKLQIKHPIVKLDFSHAEKIATLMKDANPENWGTVTSQQIIEGITTGENWMGIKVNNEVISVGSARITEFGGLIGVVATHEAHRNRGYATSIVSELVRLILEKLSTALIFVLSDNLPAVKAYSKVGFKPYRKYFFMKGEKQQQDE